MGIVQRLLFAPVHRNFRLACIFFLVPFLYSRFYHELQRNVMSVEKALVQAWEKEIVKPGTAFKRVVVGFNCNVDLVAPGVTIIESLNTTCVSGRNHETISSLEEMYETFAYFFKKGSTAERYISSDEVFHTLINQAEGTRQSQRQLGGNAALMAEKIASSFPSTDVYLVGPLGPRSQALLHPAVKRVNSTRIVKDEVHVILEYKQGEILGDWVTPSSSSFITGHDVISSSTLIIEMLFKAVSQFKPDLIVVAGVHLLEVQEKESRLEKLSLLRRHILQVSPKVPIHFQVGSLGDADFLSIVLNKIIPHVDSLGLKEQELAFLSHTAGGPFMDEYPIQLGTTHPHKVVEMLYWLIKTYGRDVKDLSSPQNKNRLQRIHFYSMTYHVMVSVGTDWSNLAAGFAAGAKIAGKYSCNIQDNSEADVVEVRMSHTFPLDKHIGKVYTFDANNPISSWVRDDVVFLFTPVLVCKYPLKVVGENDAISSSALLHSQFYRFQNWH